MYDTKLNIVWFDNPVLLSKEQLIISKTKRARANLVSSCKIKQTELEHVHEKNKKYQKKLTNYDI